MKDFLPIEAHRDSVQSLCAKRRTRTRIIYLLTLFGIAICILALPLVYVDVSIQSRGSVNSHKVNNTIQSAIYAKIEKINMHENAYVEENDTLIILNTDELDEQINRLIKRIDENNSFIQDLRALIIGKNLLLSPKYKAEQLQFNAKEREINEQIQLLKKEYEVSKLLFNSGVEAKLDFEQIKSKYQTACHQKEILINQSRNSWEIEASRLNIENKDLSSQMNQLLKRKDQYYITAPITGQIISYTGYQKGNYVQPGQVCAQISSSDSLIIECFVSPSDIGYIRVGQRAQIQVDTYNYQQWGLLEACIGEIIPDVVEYNNAPFFKIKCIASKKYLNLPNGYRGDIKKGMSVTARLFLTRRSLAQLLFDQVNNWMNPKVIAYGYKN